MQVNVKLKEVFSRLPFRFLVKTWWICRALKIYILLRKFKAFCHALSGAFVLFLFYKYGLKYVTSIQGCNLTSLRTVTLENPRMVAFSSFTKPLLCCPNVQLQVLWFMYLLFSLYWSNYVCSPNRLKLPYFCIIFPAF